MPGDEIVGFITRGYGVSVHRADCPNASEERRGQPDQAGRWIKVSWGSDTNESYPTVLEVLCKDRQGLLLDISAALSTTHTFVLGVNTRSTEDGFAVIRLEIRVKDGEQLPGCDEQAPPDFRSPAGEPAGGIGPHQGERLPRQGRCFWWRHVGRGRARHGTMRMSRQTRWLLSPPAKAQGKQRLFPRKQKERQVLKNDACCCYTWSPGPPLPSADG